MSLTLQKNWYFLLLMLCTWDILYTVFRQISFFKFQSMDISTNFLQNKILNKNKYRKQVILGESIIGTANNPISTKININDSIMACHLPVLEPFHKSIRPHLARPAQINCSVKYPLIFTTDLDSNLIQLQDPHKFGYVNCCYQKFRRRNGSEKKVTFHSKCVPIESNKTTIPNSIDFIRVTCSKKQIPHYSFAGTNSLTALVDYFAFVHLKPLLEKRIQNFTNAINSKNTDKIEYLVNSKQPSSTSDKRRLNVVIFGLDSVSHMNFIRIMPLTYKYLTKNLSAIGFHGYVKVADNTFPNLIPILVGKSVKELQKSCWKNKHDRFDKCPFIWKNYSSQGYRTAYSEDEVSQSTFNYQKQGFKKAPADYYFNTFLNQLGRKMGHRKLMNTVYCYGPRPGLDVSLKFLKQMAYTMNKTRRYFQFTWSNTATHDELNYGRLGDQALLETLEWFKIKGFSEDTALILLSDHGLRWGGHRSSFQGRIEERMPFLFFILPQWFKKQYPQAIKNMVSNRNKMTTPFDLHETLLDILHLEKNSISNQNVAKRNFDLRRSKHELPRGISLFLPIPARRTCKDADIAEHYCVCTQLNSIPVENNSVVWEGAESIIATINSLLFNFRQCSTLKLNKIFNAQVWQDDQDRKTNSTNSTWPIIFHEKQKRNKVTFTVSFSVSPSNATFEATTTRHANGTWFISGRASRTNLYGDESACVSDPVLKLYCYCGKI